MDYVLNGKGFGDVGSVLMANNYQAGPLRPYEDVDGRQYCTVNTAEGKEMVVPVNNAVSTLRKDEWQKLDDAVMAVAKPKLKVVGDVRGTPGLTYSLPDAMAYTVLQHERMSDIGEADIGMDPIARRGTDAPVFDLVNLPLPVIWADFQMSTRQVMQSRHRGAPIDVSTAELASRRVAEKAEKLLLGKLSTFSFGGGSVYGLTNFPSRLTKSMTAPTAAGWTPSVLVTEALEQRKALQDVFHYGPYAIYHSPAWDQYMDEDYSPAKGDRTLRQRLLAIGDFVRVERADYLTGYDFVMVQLTSDTIQEVVGLDVTTVRWESQGGFQINFKVLAILVPRLRADQDGNCGISHGS